MLSAIQIQISTAAAADYHNETQTKKATSDHRWRSNRSSRLAVLALTTGGGGGLSHYLLARRTRRSHARTHERTPGSLPCVGRARVARRCQQTMLRHLQGPQQLPERSASHVSEVLFTNGSCENLTYLGMTRLFISLLASASLHNPCRNEPFSFVNLRNLL